MRGQNLLRFVLVCVVCVLASASPPANTAAAPQQVPAAEIAPSDDLAVKVPKLSTTEEAHLDIQDNKQKVVEGDASDDYLEHGTAGEALPAAPASGNATEPIHNAAQPAGPVVPERFEDAAAGLQKGLQDLLKGKEETPPDGGEGGVTSLTTSSTAEGSLGQKLEQVLQSVGNASGIVYVQRADPPPVAAGGGGKDGEVAAGKPKPNTETGAPIRAVPAGNASGGPSATAPSAGPQPAASPSAGPPKAPISADATESGRAEHDAGPSVVFLKGQLGESCTAACARAGGGKLVCLAAQLPAANSCAMLNKAFGCGGDSKCLAVPGIDKPAAVLLPGAQDPLCFLHQGFASAPPGAAECGAAQHLSSRLCPCALSGAVGGSAEANAVLSAARAVDPLALQAEREKVLAMAAAVDVLIKQYNGTAATLAATQARLERLQAIDKAEEEIADIMRAVHSHKIDYETGKVTMPDGSKLSYSSAVGRLKELQQLTKIKSQLAKEADAGEEAGKAAGEQKDAEVRGADAAQQPPPPQAPGKDRAQPSAPAGDGSGKDVLLPVDGDQIVIIDPAILSYDMELLQDMGVLMCVGAVGGVLFSFTGLPPSFGFLLMGMAAGPNGWDAIRDTAGVSSVAQFGVVFPLFLNGMQFGLKFKNAAALSSLAAQSTLISAVVFTGLAMAAFAVLGITTGPGEGVLMGMALSLASPAVSIANLIDHGKLDSTGGQVTLAMLAVQDLIMGVMLSLPHALGVLAGPGATAPATGPDAPVSEAGFVATHAKELQAAALLMRSALSLLGVVVFMFLWSRGVFRRMLARFGLCSTTTCPGVAPADHKRDEELSPEQRRTSEEVLLLGLVGACMVGALSTEALGLSLEMGAFLAGLALASAGIAPVSKLVAATMPLSRLFSAMFLTSVGLVLSPVFLWNNLGMLLLALVLLMSAKAGVLYVVLRSFRLSSSAAVVATVAMSSMAEVGLAFTGKAHAMGLISRYCYLLLLSTVVLSTIASPLLHKAQHHIQRMLVYLDCGSAGSDDASAAVGGIPSPLNYAAVPAGVNVAEADFRSNAPEETNQRDGRSAEPVFQASTVHAAARSPQRTADQSRLRVSSALSELRDRAEADI